ncbi:hypothetical protein RHGRI_012923 [Rhododendron griersonianum]|uniref:Uncharacterized protein n=1 Tax=Rhododendron griersonianum TaxID=479676 RepID=A0AAV6K3W8_9ERIC|nr:hypothetical protein RHGRI_012923 [Rhododendron griersonianum]
MDDLVSVSWKKFRSLLLGCNEKSFPGGLLCGHSLDMSITEKKRLTCFLYCGGERRVLLNGTFHYVGGVSEAMLIEDNVSDKELLSKISSCLNIPLHNKSIFYNTKSNKTKYLRMKYNNGVKMMFYLNEDEVDVFDEDPFYTSTRKSNIVESNETLRDMSITEKKRLTFFFYCGGERRVLPNGTFHYVGGISEAMLIEDNVSNEELLSKIGSCLNISLHSKLIFYNTKRDKTKYLRLKDDNGVKMLFYLNEDEVDVFVDEDPIHTSTRESNIVKSNETPRAVLIEDDISYQELLKTICNILNISTSYKSIFYNSKRDKTKYLHMKDGNGVQMLFHLNEEEVDVFVENV